MKTFFLCRRDDGRIILDETFGKHAVIQEIKAATWLDAREMVKEINYWHNPGYGWYER